MSLVSGYDSDSGSENGNAASSSVAGPSTSKPAGGLASFLPPPKAAAAAASSSAAPSQQAAAAAAGKKKRQFTIESLSSLGASSTAEPAAKRAKVEGLPSGAPKLGLFGMLPAPKAAPAPPPKSEQKSDAAPSQSIASTAAEKAGGDASFVGVQLAAPLSEGEDEDEEEPGQAKKAKGNDAFRAMLGLAPSSKPKPKPKPQLAASSSSLAQASKAAASTSQAKTAAAAPKPLEDDFGQGGFFGIAQAPTASSSSSSTSAPSFTPAPSKFSISAAPTHDDGAGDEAASYPGWSQDPDGSWVPLTPAAHAQYAAWLEEQRLEAAKKKPERDAAAAELARAGVDVASLRTVDAGADAQAAYDAQPPARSDARYAAAAAAVGSAASIEEAGGEEDKKMDKKTGFRARQKGQLSALVAQAEENKERLEERWARGKTAQRQSGQKYGF